MFRNWMKRLCLALGVAMAAGPGVAATFQGEFWNATTTISNLAQANAIIAAGPATATFQSTRIDYPAGAIGPVSSATTLAAFLGVDAPSLSGAGSVNLIYSVFRFTGFLDLVGGNTIFRVGSDDGFRLTVGGVQIASFNGNRAFASTTVTRNLAAGITPVELIYWENSGNTGVEFRVNNAFAVPSTVPLPASLWLLIAGVGGLGLMARRRRLPA